MGRVHHLRGDGHEAEPVDRRLSLQLEQRGKLICEALGDLIALIRPDWKIGRGFKFKPARFAGPNVADASLAHAP